MNKKTIPQHHIDRVESHGSALLSESGPGYGITKLQKSKWDDQECLIAVQYGVTSQSDSTLLARATMKGEIFQGGIPEIYLNRKLY